MRNNTRPVASSPLFRIVLSHRRPFLNYLLGLGIAVICLGISWEGEHIRGAPLFLAPLAGGLIATILLGGGPAIFAGIVMGIGLRYWLVLGPGNLYPEPKLILMRLFIFSGTALILGRISSELRLGYLQAEELKEETEKEATARQQIVDIVSHDLRNPIASVQMYASLLLKNKKTPSAEIDESEYLKGVLRSADRMNRITCDLLDASQIEMGRFSTVRTNESLKPIILDALDSFRTLADSHSIRFRTELEIPEIQLSVDRGRIIQAISNLLHNAVKYSPDGSTILIAVTQTDENLNIAITDEGPGIEPNKMKHIFDRYWADKMATAHGSGLGLFISKGIARSHQGDLTAANNSKRGATFTLTIPISSRATLPLAA